MRSEYGIILLGVLSYCTSYVILAGRIQIREIVAGRKHGERGTGLEADDIL